MAISVVSSADNTGASDTPEVTLPATTVEAGDIIILFAAANDATTFSSAPASFTQVCDGLSVVTGSDTLTQAWYLVASGGEESTTYQWAFDDASLHRWITGAVVLRGVDAAVFDVTPVHATHHLDAQNDNTPECSAITTQTDGAMVLAMSFIHSSGNTLSAAASDSGDGEWMNVIDVTDADVGALGTHEIIATAGAVGGDVHTYTGGAVSSENQTLIFALKPAAGGGVTLTIPIAMHHYRQLANA